MHGKPSTVPNTEQTPKNVHYFFLTSSRGKMMGQEYVLPFAHKKALDESSLGKI